MSALGETSRRSTGSLPLAVIAHWASIVALSTVLVWLVRSPAGFERLLRLLVPGQDIVIYPEVPLSQLLAEQVYLVAVASSISIVVGVALGLLALSRPGRPFRDVIVSLGNLAQAVPTVAVMMIAIPVIGYGAKPVIIGLVLYGILPIVLNVIVGIEGVQPAARDAAIGVGMSPLQRLSSVELPLAFPVILGAVKNVIVINVSAATVGAVAAAGGLGQPILAGFATYNPAFIIEGALPVAVLALLVDRVLTPPGNRAEGKPSLWRVASALGDKTLVVRFPARNGATQASDPTKSGALTTASSIPVASHLRPHADAGTLDLDSDGCGVDIGLSESP